MANGAVARLPFDPPSAPAATAGKPGAASAATAIQVGVAMADAVEFVGRALIDVEGGAPLRAATRELGGTRIAAVVTLWLDHFGEIDDFRSLAQREGCRVLLERHAAEMRQQLDKDIPDAAIADTFDELCACVVTAANEVVAIEMAYRTN
jgi:hypothetical protein